VAIVSSESFADSSHAGIVERHVLCAQSPVHLAEFATLSGSSRIKLITRFNYCLQNISTKITLQ